MPKVQKRSMCPTPDAATLEHLRSLTRATRRLWRDLEITPCALAPRHEEHSHRVGFFSLRIAHALGLVEERCQRIYRAADLHDVGGLAVPQAILRKPGVLTAAERSAMQVHPLISCELLGAFLSTEDLAGIVLSHHERYDGHGYPNGLEGTKIPLDARVLAIADSMDAMMSRRPYRDTLVPADAQDELMREAGHQFDPSIVETLVRQGEFIAMTE